MERNIRIDWQSIVKEAVKRRKEQNLFDEIIAVKPIKIQYTLRTPVILTIKH